MMQMFEKHYGKKYGILFKMCFFSRLFLQTQEVGFFLDKCCKF